MASVRDSANFVDASTTSRPLTETSGVAGPSPIRSVCEWRSWLVFYDQHFRTELVAALNQLLSQKLPRTCPPCQMVMHHGLPWKHLVNKQCLTGALHDSICQRGGVQCACQPLSPQYWPTVSAHVALWCIPFTKHVGHCRTRLNRHNARRRKQKLDNAAQAGAAVASGSMDVDDPPKAEDASTSNRQKRPATKPATMAGGSDFGLVSCPATSLDVLELFVWGAC
jgi:hypothetical protein